MYEPSVYLFIPVLSSLATSSFLCLTILGGTKRKVSRQCHLKAVAVCVPWARATWTTPYVTK